MSKITNYNGFEHSFNEQKAYEYIDVLKTFLNDMLQKAKAKGFVVGISGGIDSSLTYALAKSVTDNTIGVVIPVQSMLQADLADIQALEQRFNTKFKTIKLGAAFKAISKELNLANPLSIANIKPRLRMTTLYAIAQENNYLVLGTDNADEVYIGYFTKYGDGGADLLPICQLTKGEVAYLALLLGVPDSIINKKPSAGLWDGQTDEGELGFSYRQLDFYINHLDKPQIIKQHLTKDIINKIEYRHKNTEHKRQPVFKPKPVE
ncbi:NAD(+) synthase [Mycoplasma sp. 5912]